MCSHGSLTGSDRPIPSTRKLSDIVALADVNSTRGHGDHEGSVGIGVVSSADSINAGHGPGVTLRLTATRGEIDLLVVEGVNLSGLLEIGTARH